MTAFYGARPKPFVLDNESYYIGNDIGTYMKCFRGSLYKRFPLLWKRVATHEEKKDIARILGSSSVIVSTVMLLKASEVDDLLEGNEDKYRASGSGSGISSAQPLFRQENILSNKSKNASATWSNTQVLEYACFV